LPRSTLSHQQMDAKAENRKKNGSQEKTNSGKS